MKLRERWVFVTRPFKVPTSWASAKMKKKIKKIKNQHYCGCTCPHAIWVRAYSDLNWKKYMVSDYRFPAIMAKGWDRLVDKSEPATGPSFLLKSTLEIRRRCSDSGKSKFSPECRGRDQHNHLLKRHWSLFERRKVKLGVPGGQWALSLSW